jgi:hypothetical protein
MCKGDCEEDENGSNHGLEVEGQVAILSGIFITFRSIVSTLHSPDVRAEVFSSSMRLLVTGFTGPSTYMILITPLPCR